MTSIVTVSAHPALPSTVVEVHQYDDKSNESQTYVLQDGAIQTFTISGSQSLNVRETNTVVVALYVPPEPALSDPPVIEQPALSTTG